MINKKNQTRKTTLMATEIFKSIPSIPGAEAGTGGTIKYHGQEVRVIRGHYHKVRIEEKLYFVHRLVAEAFLPNPQGLPEINHKNEVCTDNRLCNLEWCDSHYNHTYGTVRQRISDSKSKQVAQYDLDGNFIRVWKSQTEVRRIMGWNGCHIGECCDGKVKTYKGYKWHWC